MDINMPEMDGVTCTKEVLATHKDVRVLAPNYDERQPAYQANDECRCPWLYP